jgi:hypothetical protein
MKEAVCMKLGPSKRSCLLSFILLSPGLEAWALPASRKVCCFQHAPFVRVQTHVRFILSDFSPQILSSSCFYDRCMFQLEPFQGGSVQIQFLWLICQVVLSSNFLGSFCLHGRTAWALTLPPHIGGLVQDFIFFYSLPGTPSWPEWSSTIHWMPITTQLWMNLWFHLGTHSTRSRSSIQVDR